MRTLIQIIPAFTVALLLGCGSQSGDKIKTSRTPPLVDTPKRFVMNYGADDTTRLFAFVGKKISVDPLPNEKGAMDNGFKAKYLILQKVYGNFPKDTIEFAVYDHYGVPPFSRFTNVLLYVSADSGTYYHQKYMYNDVYKTKDGRWAGTYATDDYEHPYNKHTNIKPVKIDFSERVIYPYNNYPKPYFKITGDSAIAVYGNYVEDLVTLKKEGTLTARKLFEATAQQEEDMVEASQPGPRKLPPTADDLKFLTFWKDFAASLNEPGLKKFRQIALDTLYVCNQLIPADKFIENCFNQLIDEEVRKRIVDKTKFEYTFTEVEFYNLLTYQVKKEILKTHGSYRLRKMLVTRSTKNNNAPTIYFDFIESKKGYRLYEISHHWFKDCCK